MKTKPKNFHAPSKKVLVLSVSGIGNSIMQSPLINALARQDNLIVDVLFNDTGGRAVFEYDDRIRTKYIIPAGLVGKLRLIRQLRGNSYDYTVAGFPSNLPEFNVLPFLVGAPIRITHAYAVGRLRTLSFLSNRTLPAQASLHDIEQNLQLLKRFDLPVPAAPRITFSLKAANEAFARWFVEHFDTRPILGIHPGSGPLKAKRWPRDRFSELVERLKTSYNVIVFGSAAETRAFESIPGIHTCTSNLNDTAALIRRCHKFISADTGLMHIAAVFGIRQFVLWGPTRYSRTRPWSNQVTILGRTDLDCL